MSDLDDLKSKPKAKRLLKGVHFDYIGSHLCYTDASQGGAASNLNEPYLLKSQEINKALTPEQQVILDKIGEESTPLDKSLMEDKNTPSSSKEVKGEDDNVNKGKDNTMSDNTEIMKQLEQLRHENSVIKAEKKLSGYSFDADVETGVAEAIAGLESDAQGFIVKAFDVLVARKDEALNKAKEDADKEKKDENPLAKALEKEEGHEAEAEGESTGLLEKALIAKKELQKKGAK